MGRSIFAGAILAASLSAAIGALAQTGPKLAAQQSDKYGEYVVDSDRRPIYLFTADKPGKGQQAESNCYDECAQVWPPVVAMEEPQAGGNLKPELLGTFKRKDGRTQVTYGGWPLYYYAKDASRGEAAGQDVRSFGGEWYLVSPSGEKQEKASG